MTRTRTEDRIPWHTMSSAMREAFDYAMGIEAKNRKRWESQRRMCDGMGFDPPHPPHEEFSDARTRGVPVWAYALANTLYQDTDATQGMSPHHLGSVLEFVGMQPDPVEIAAAVSATWRLLWAVDTDADVVHVGDELDAYLTILDPATAKHCELD